MTRDKLRQHNSRGFTPLKKSRPKVTEALPPAGRSLTGFTRHDFVRRNQGGFTLVEALVALAILTVGLIPAFAQVQASFRLSRVIRQNLTASMLAQEGIELIRGMRDDNWFDPGAPLFDDDYYPFCDVGCLVQYNESVPRPLSGNPPLKIDNGRYQYDTGNDTLFARRMTVTELSPTHVLVVSEVTWDNLGDPKSVVVEDHLFDWLNP